MQEGGGGVITSVLEELFRDELHDCSHSHVLLFYHSNHSLRAKMKLRRSTATTTRLVGECPVATRGSFYRYNYLRLIHKNGCSHNIMNDLLLEIVIAEARGLAKIWIFSTETIAYSMINTSTILFR